MFKAVKIAVITGITGLLLATGTVISPAQAGEVPPNERLISVYSQAHYDGFMLMSYTDFQVRLRNPNGTVPAPNTNTYELKTWDCYGSWAGTVTQDNLRESTAGVYDEINMIMAGNSFVNWGYAGSNIVNDTQTAWSIPAKESFTWSVKVTPPNGDDPYVISGTQPGEVACGSTGMPRFEDPNNPVWNFPARQPGGNNGPTQPLTKVVKWKGKVGKAKAGKVVKIKRPKVAKGTSVTFAWYVDGVNVKTGPQAKLKLAKPQKGKKVTAQVRVVKPGYRVNTKNYGFGVVK